jgi:HK97 family phage portal protein
MLTATVKRVHTADVETESGLLVVRDYRRSRDNIPNENPPIGSVGPNIPPGYGDTHVMYDAQLPPAQVQAWQGWPLEWDTPWWNDAQTFATVSTLGTCIDLNTRQLASFPVYGLQGIKVVALPEWARNPEPSLYSDWTEAAKQVFNCLQSAGETILWATGRYANKQVARWVVLNPQFVNVEWLDGEIAYEYNGQTLDRADVCHIKYQAYPMNLRGIGPLQWAARNIVSASALEKAITNLATRGGIPWAVIKHPRHLNRTEATDLQTAWVASAAMRNGAPAILSGGIELETLTISPKEMALIDMRIFDETRVASALGVPPFLVGLPNPQGMTYSNAQGLFDFHWRSTLRPMAAAVARAMSEWLLPRGTDLEFNRDEYVRPEMKERAETYAILNKMVDVHGNPAMSVDEVRMAERFLPNEPLTPDDATSIKGLTH